MKMLIPKEIPIPTLVVATLSTKFPGRIPKAIPVNMWVVVPSTLLFCLYYVATSTFSYWKKKRIPHEQPAPLVGGLVQWLCCDISLAEQIQQVYNKHPTARYIGSFQMRRPTLIVRDPELIKVIAIKEFDSFPEHTAFASTTADPLWSNNIFALPAGDTWRDLRAIMSNAFSNVRLKSIFVLITECANQFVAQLDTKRQEEEQRLEEVRQKVERDQKITQQTHRSCPFNLPASAPQREEEEEAPYILTMEAKEACRMITADIISSVAFGIKVNTLENPNNEMFINGIAATSHKGFINSLKFFMSGIHPKLPELLGVTFIDKPTNRFFTKVVKDALIFREQNKVKRDDILQLLIDAKHKIEKEEKERQEAGTSQEPHTRKTIITDEILTSQAVVFFFAGFDTVSTAMSYLAYELALNPEIQQRVYEELQQVGSTADLEFEDIARMKYLDMVLHETLRKWPPFAITDRKVKHKYTFLPAHPDEKPLSVDPDIIVQIPIFAIHRDPKYYPNPDKFDPERFTDEAKAKRKPETFIPFGAGRRSCLGFRFAILEIKTVFFYLLRRFEIVVVPKTEIPLRFARWDVNPTPANGIWLGFKPRKLEDEENEETSSGDGKYRDQNSD